MRGAEERTLRFLIIGLICLFAVFFTASLGARNLFEDGMPPPEIVLPG